MIEAALMIEGQDGLNWPRWQKIVRLAEDLGFAGLYRSDHFTNAVPPDKDSLELWVSLTWLACSTQRIEFGPLVSPVSFRHPTITARMAAAVNDLSGGRLTLGLGAGWQEREHSHFGFDLLGIPERMQRFEEGLQVITRLLQSDQPVDFSGRYYRLQDAVLLPRPQRPGSPPILIGGNGKKYTLPLAARFAQEWNAVFLNPEQFKERSLLLDELLEKEGRDPRSLKRSVMLGTVFGRDQAEVERRVKERTRGKASPAELRSRGVIVGTAPEFVEQIKRLEEAGAQRVMLQWLYLDDIEGIQAMAEGVLPELRR